MEINVKIHGDFGGRLMTVENIFQYVIDNGYIGGVVIAESLEEAMDKVKKYASERYPHLTNDRAKALVWCIKDNSHVTNDVYEIFNE